MKIFSIILSLTLFTANAAFAQVKENAMQNLKTEKRISSDAPEQFLSISILATGTGKDSNEARNNAQARAFIESFNQLVAKRYSDIADIVKVEVSEDEIVDLNIGYEIADEEISFGAYKANMIISYDPVVLRKFFEEKQIIKRSVYDNAVLIVPVYQNKSNPVLWGDAPLWRFIWSKLSLSSGGKVIVPMGDPRDLAEVDAFSAYSINYENIFRMAERYGVRHVKVIIAELEQTEDGENYMQIQIRDLSKGNTSYENKQIVSQTGEETKAFLNRVAAKLFADVLEEQRTQIAEFENAKAKELPAQVYFRNLNQWSKIRAAFKRIEAIRDFDIQQIQFDRADIVINYDGDLQALLRRFKAENLRAIEGQEKWQIGVQTNEALVN